MLFFKMSVSVRTTEKSRRINCYVPVKIKRTTKKQRRRRRQIFNFTAPLVTNFSRAIHLFHSCQISWCTLTTAPAPSCHMAWYPSHRFYQRCARAAGSSSSPFARQLFVWLHKCISFASSGGGRLDGTFPVSLLTWLHLSLLKLCGNCWFYFYCLHHSPCRFKRCIAGGSQAQTGFHVCRVFPQHKSFLNFVSNGSNLSQHFYKRKQMTSLWEKERWLS